MTNLSVRERRRLAALCEQARSAPVACEWQGKSRFVVVAVEEYVRGRSDDKTSFDDQTPLRN
jgi:hypothetical protein